MKPFPALSIMIGALDFGSVRFTRAAISPNCVDLYGSSKPGKRSFGRFSRPLLEVYFQTSFQYEPKVKSLAVAEIFRYCKGFRLSYSYSCLLDQKYKRGVLSVAFDKNGSIYSWATTPYPFAVLASRRSKKYDPRSGAQMPCVELEHIEQETGRIIGSIPSTQQNSIKGVCKSGDTLFGKLRPYLRKYAFVKKDMVCSSEIWSLVPSETIIPEYLFYLVQTDEFIKIANISSGTKMPRAEWSNIEKSVFSVPSKEVQAQIVQTLRRLDSRMLDAIDMLGELQLMKEGLLQQLFI